MLPLIQTGGASGGASGVTSFSGDGTLITNSGSTGAVTATIGTLPASANVITINAQTGTSYAIADGDRGKLITFSNTSSIAATIAQAGSGGNFASGWWAKVLNINSGYVQITPTTSTIGGATSLVLPPGASCLLVSNGTNYLVLDGETIGSMVAGAGSFANAYYGSAFRNDILSLTSGNQDAAIALGTAKVVHLTEIHRPLVLRKMSIRINSAITANVLMGVYNLDGSTKYADTGNIANGGAAGNKTASVTSVLLMPGLYYVYVTGDNASITVNGINTAAAYSDLLNVNYARRATVANAASGGACPATLGAITGSSGNTNIVDIILE